MKGDGCVYQDRPFKKELAKGMLVEITENNTIHRGYIQSFRSGDSKKGVLVELQSGEVGRVIQKVSKEAVQREHFIFFNRLLNEKHLYSLYDNDTQRFVVLPTRKGHALAFAFTTWEQADQYLRNIKRHAEGKRWSVRRLPYFKGIVKALEIAGANTVRVNDEKTITLEKLKKFQAYVEQ